MKRFTVVAFVVFVLLAAPASAGSIPAGWSWVGTGPKVAVVGDSLIWQAEHGSSLTTDPGYLRHYLTDELNAAGYATRVAARSGATTDALYEWVWWRRPTVIVMALGTNDLYFRVPLATAKANVRTFLGRWGNACPVLVGVKASVPRGINPTVWNGWLKAEAAARGGVFVDWAGLSASHPEWFVTYRGGLDVHQTVAGQAAYRQAIINGTEECNELLQRDA